MPHGSVRCLLSLVVLLFFLLVAPVAPAAPPAGLPDHCKDLEMACFHNKNCGVEDDAELQTTKIDQKKCDVHMEIRPYSNKKALIRLKAKNGPSVTVSLQGSAEPLFGCEIETVQGKKIVKHIGDTKLTYGGSWIGGPLACEFLYEATAEPASDTDPVLNVNKAEIAYGTNKKIVGVLGNNEYMTGKLQCDMDWLDHKFDPHEKFLYAAADRRFSTVTCPADQELVYGDDEQKAKVAVGGISCNKIENPAPGEHPWRYEIFKEKNDANPLTVTRDAQVKVACQSIACKQCSKTAPGCPDGSLRCTAPKPATEGDCDFLRCKNGILAVNGGTPTLGELECKPLDIEIEQEKRREARWTFGGAAVTSVECKEAVSCQDVKPLQLKGGADIDLKKPPLTCGEQRKITIDDLNKTDTIQCDSQTGGWYYNVSGVRTDVAKNATLSCEVVVATTEAVAGASMGMTVYAAMGAGVIAIVAVVILLVFCFVIKPTRKRDAARKIKTISSNNTGGDSKSGADNLKTAIPVGVPQAPAAPTTSPDLANHPFTPAPELVEKTMIANTPSVESKQGQTLHTAVGNTATTDPTDKLPSMIEGAVQATVRHPEDDDVKRIPGEKRAKVQIRDENGQIIDEDLSEPQSIKIGKDGNVLPPKKKNKHTKVPPLPNDDEDKSKSEADPTKKNSKAAPPSDVGPKPQVFALNEKEDKIRRGATVKMAEYPTLAEIESDWEDKPDKDKKEKTKGKTVPSAVTPEVPPATERTQNNNTRNTVDKNDPELENLVTQLDTTVEQKEAEARRKKK